MCNIVTLTLYRGDVVGDKIYVEYCGDMSVLRSLEFKKLVFGTLSVCLDRICRLSPTELSAAH